MKTPTRLDMATTFRNSGQLGTLPTGLAQKIQSVSGGDIDIRVYGHNEFCPSFANFDAVSKGDLDSAFSTPAYWAAKDSAFLLFSGGVPFGAEANEYMAWLYYGGGRELQIDLYAHYNIVSIPAGLLPPECGGWFRLDIKKAADFNGLKLRFFGLGALVMEKFGATTFGAGSHVGMPEQAYEALREGTIDGVEFLTPAIDIEFRFHEVAPYFYLPGWHQPVTLFDLMVNEKTWRALSDTERAQIEICCGDTMREGLAEGEALQVCALRKLQELGVTIRRFSPELLTALSDAWNEIAVSEADKNPNFKKVWESYTDFRKDYAAWKDMGHLR